MIKTQECIFLGCNHQPLESPEEIDIGLCHRHTTGTRDPHHLTLSCWSCGSLLETIRKRELIRGVEIKDDYLFSKQCPTCSSVSLDNLQYITINDSVSESSTLATEEGLLIDNDGVIVNASAKKG